MGEFLFVENRRTETQTVNILSVWGTASSNCVGPFEIRILMKIISIKVDNGWQVAIAYSKEYGGISCMTKVATAGEVLKLHYKEVSGTYHLTYLYLFYFV